MSIIQTATRLTQKYEKYAAISNVNRLLIIAYLVQNKEGTWSELRQFLEKNLGSLNPNTLHFHLKALVESGMVKRTGNEERIIYELGSLPDDVVQVIRTDIASKAKKP